MTTIVVNNKGELFIDGNPKLIGDLTQDFLEKLVDDSLRDEVLFDIDGDMPLAAFFKEIQDGTKAGSALRKAMEEQEQNENDDNSVTVSDVPAKVPDSNPIENSF